MIRTNSRKLHVLGQSVEIKPELDLVFETSYWVCALPAYCNARNQVDRRHVTRSCTERARPTVGCNRHALRERYSRLSNSSKKSSVTGSQA